MSSLGYKDIREKTLRKEIQTMSYSNPIQGPARHYCVTNPLYRDLWDLN
jgi:hypothetical protein